MSFVTVDVHLDPDQTVEVTISPYVLTGGGGTYKTPVKAASIANVNLASTISSLDGVTINDDDRFLLKNQSTGSQNGIYRRNPVNDLPVRAPDGLDGQLVSGVVVPVEQGTVNDNTMWMLGTNNPIVVGTTSQTWVQFGSGGAPVPPVIFDVADQAAMLALSSAVQGDTARRTDDRRVYQLSALPPATLGNWKAIGSTVDPATIPYVHIGTSTDARPIVGGLVLWVTTASPVNATSSDLWVQPVGA